MGDEIFACNFRFTCQDEIWQNEQLRVRWTMKDFAIMCAMENDRFCKCVCNDGWLIVQLKMTNCKTEKKNEKKKEEKKKKREGPQLE